MDISNLRKIMDRSVTPYHAVIEVKAILDSSGFIELKESEKWNLKLGCKYYLLKNQSSLIAFSLGTDFIPASGIKMIAVHTDFPSLKIKPNPVINYDGKIYKINTEIYGSPILSTWFDRELSIAGKVIYSEDDIIKSVIVDTGRAVAVMPNLAIHLDRDNKNKEISKDKEILPIIDPSFIKANQIDFKSLFNDEKLENVIGHDLFFYSGEKSAVTGDDGGFFISSRIDNHVSLFCGADAVASCENGNSLSILAAFDNEEVGSRSGHGGGSPFLTNTLERIMLNLGYGREDYLMAISQSSIISADQAHSYHPNYPDRYDQTNKPCINNGVAVKLSSNKSYSTDADGYSKMISRCSKNGIILQTFINSSDVRGGSTLGPILSANFPSDIVDIGIPMLAMHSIRETAGVKDIKDFMLILKDFYNL